MSEIDTLVTDKATSDEAIAPFIERKIAVLRA
jgi:hypothetical protein